MTKMLVFDMDGTIANLYEVEDWLVKLRAEDPSPYAEAQPLYDMDVLNSLLDILKDCGWKIAITSWLAKESSKKYDEQVRAAKKAWLEKYHFPYDEVHIVKYGTTKANCTRKAGGFQILIDDNEDVRKGWSLGYSTNETDILSKLSDLIMAEYI